MIDMEQLDAEARRELSQAISARVSAGETYEGIGREVGVPKETVWHWSRGRAPRKLAAILYLMGRAPGAAKPARKPSKRAARGAV
jgi:hypothetical protein